MSTTTKPTFVFVPGAWHRPDYFNPVIESLATHGFESVAISNRAVDSTPAATSFQPDVEGIKDTLTGLLCQGKDVILVMHSYGGVIGTEAAGLVAAGQKESGRIRRLVYVAAHVVLPGQSLMTSLAEAPPPAPDIDHVIFDTENGYYLLKEGAAEAFYHDIPADQRHKYYAFLGKQPMATFDTPTTQAPWKTIPATFVHTRTDRAHPVWQQEFMVKRLQTAEQTGTAGMPFGDGLGEFYLDCGHTPFLAKTEEFVDILLKVERGL